jgi:hypothetical protein
MNKGHTLFFMPQKCWDVVTELLNLGVKDDPRVCCGLNDISCRDLLADVITGS